MTSEASEISVVMAVFNNMAFLPQVVPALLASGRRHGGVEFIFVDNGSTDGTAEYLAGLGDDVRVFDRSGDSLGGMRNFGAAAARGRFLSFLDSDCLIDDSYFAAALTDLRESGAAATGHEYDLPSTPGWIEAAWHDLHFHARARDVAYLNAGNFFITRMAFERVNGFRENLWTGEDAELGQRLTAAGHRIHANPLVRVVHLGNPKSLRHFFRRQVWHGIGMFGTVRWGSIDKPTVMMLLHLGATVAGVATLVWGRSSLVTRVAILLASQLVVPAVTVAYRVARIGRLRSVPQNVFLYWLYYWARLQALGVILARRGRGYRK